jgi:hypothetical protein
MGREGLILLWNDNVITLTNVSTRLYHISPIYLPNKLTTIYGPIRHNIKDSFLQEHVMQTNKGTNWLVTREFNQIYHAQDKNHGNSNQST